MHLSATYSPDDNKLRLYPLYRLGKEEFERVKAAGFKWAPKQELFVAPAWTPEREDLCIELAGEIEDEDKSLVERAEERADRFGEYSDKRAADAERAHAGVEAICEHIPLGQPILVGHHSERRARKDAERIDQGMRRAVSMWETSKYWTARAAGALRHAKHKERKDVRARRIKGLEADLRKMNRARQESQGWLTKWQAENLTMERATAMAGYDHVSVRVEGRAYDTSSLYSELKDGRMDLAQAIAEAEAHHVAIIRRAGRWANHIELRLSYERAMLAEAGGLVAERFRLEVGGRVLVRGEWLTVLRVNKSGDTVVSVTTNSRYVTVKSVEEIENYQAPDAEAVAKVQAAQKLAPMVNYPGEGFRHLSKAEWNKINKDYKGVRTQKATADHGAYRYRSAMSFGSGCHTAQVYITDAKRVDPPAPPTSTTAVTAIPAPERVLPVREYQAKEPTKFDALREQLASGGVQVAVAPQLFPTPADLAERMASLAELAPGQSVLEPSAGTGQLLQAARSLVRDIELTAIEIHGGLCQRLRATYANVHQADFLQVGAEQLGRFDRVIMNPPFENSTDIKHIEHAFSMLKPGGVLVAICAGGPRQVDRLKPWALATGGSWEDLPADTFKSQGTMVRTALLTLRAA